MLWFIFFSRGETTRNCSHLVSPTQLRGLKLLILFNKFKDEKWNEYRRGCFCFSCFLSFEFSSSSVISLSVNGSKIFLKIEVINWKLLLYYNFLFINFEISQNRGTSFMMSCGIQFPCYWKFFGVFGWGVYDISLILQ